MRVLTDDEVLALRAMRAAGTPYKDISAHFGVPYRSVQQLALGRRRMYADRAAYARKTGAKKPPEGGEG